MYITPAGEDYHLFYRVLFHEVAHREYFGWLKEEPDRYQYLYDENFYETTSEVMSSLLCSKASIYHNTKPMHLEFLEELRSGMPDKRLLGCVYPVIKILFQRLFPGQKFYSLEIPQEIRTILTKVR